MPFDTASFRATLRRVQWRRGLRAGMAVSTLMVFCHLLGKPIGWASLGALQGATVDNGGPYRSRLSNILTVLAGGSIALLLGSISAGSLPVAIIVTALFCFATTMARVLSQPLASSSVTILVCYIVAYGGPTHSLSSGTTGVLYFVLGGLW